MHSPEKPVLVWDVDDVKAQTIVPLMRSANETFGLHITRETFSEDFVSMIGRPREVVTEWFLRFCHEQFPYLEPVKNMPGVVSFLGEHANHAQLTSRRSAFYDVTARLKTIPAAVCMIDNEVKHPLSVAASGLWGIHLNENLRQPVPVDAPPTFLTARAPEEVADLVMNVVLPSAMEQRHERGFFGEAGKLAS